MGEDFVFRIGIWPGGPIRIPPFLATEVWLKDQEFIHFAPYFADSAEVRQTLPADAKPEDDEEWGGFEHWFDDVFVDHFVGPDRSVILPEEFYLRELRDLRLDRPEEILKFTETWGVLGRPALEEIGAPYFEMKYFKDGRRAAPLARLDLMDECSALVDPHCRKGESWRHRQFVHLREIAVHAALIRDLTRVWDVLSSERDVAELKHDWESPWLPPPQHPIIAHGMLVDYLSHALRPFHVALTLLVNDKAFYQPWQPTLFATACLQLANDIAQKQPYRRCHKCGRQFVIQRGRAKYGQNRREGEIKFCSSSCAKAQAQRDLYRRQVEARRLHQEGQSVEAIAETLGAKVGSVTRWVKGR
ncbi:MAG: hypothetical protein ACYC6T_18345 [Thermoleophilia bacterium]